MKSIEFRRSVIGKLWVLFWVLAPLTALLAGWGFTQSAVVVAFFALRVSSVIDSEQVAINIQEIQEIQKLTNKGK
ncbi:MAG: hypothetical protein Q8P69_00295 [bacterium]|nr:hypothetical protein [bacterium]MDZ4209661.1 hypothetical protein [Candidatus Curtissbacteria bacterium]